MEEWRDIAGYEGLYQISSLGRVKSRARRSYNGFGNYYKTLSERILKTFCTGIGGNKSVSLYKDGVRKDFLIKTLVSKHFT